MQPSQGSDAPDMAPAASGTAVAVKQPTAGGGMDIAAMLHQLTGSAAAAAAQAVQLQQQLLAQQQEQQAQVMQMLKRRHEHKHTGPTPKASTPKQAACEPQPAQQQQPGSSSANPLAAQIPAVNPGRATVHGTVGVAQGMQLLEVPSESDLMQLAMYYHTQPERKQEQPPPQQQQPPQQQHHQQPQRPGSNQYMDLDVMPNPTQQPTSFAERFAHQQANQVPAQSPRMSTGTTDSALLGQLQQQQQQLPVGGPWPAQGTRLDRVSSGSSTRNAPGDGARAAGNMLGSRMANASADLGSPRAAAHADAAGGPSPAQPTTSNASAASAEGGLCTTLSGGMSVDVQHYPPAEAPHNLVLADREVFNTTLKRLHDRLGSKLRVPVVGGQELDLWMLYRQVVAYDGLASVVAHKKWADVCAPFNFPATFTSRSFTMRKLYTQLLWHYEQVYMHGATGPLLPAPAPEPGPLAMTAMAMEAKHTPPTKRRTLSGPLTAGHHMSIDVPMLAPPNLTLPAGLRGSHMPGGLLRSPLGAPSSVPPPFTALRTDMMGTRGLEHVPVGTEVRGVITHKFPMGFSVQLDVQGAVFNGMLYCPPEQSTSHIVANPGLGSSQSSPGMMADMSALNIPPGPTQLPTMPIAFGLNPVGRSLSEGMPRGSFGFGSFEDVDGFPLGDQFQGGHMRQA